LVKVLVSWSGGLDSTYLLYHHLKNTDYEIHAHHVKLLNHGGMLKRQLEAVESINPILQKIRPFKFTQSVQYALPLGDVFISSIDCARICFKEEYDYLDVGWVKNDDGGDAETNLKMMKQVMSAINENDNYTTHQFTWRRPIKHITKKECWDGLPEEIREKIWWCREEEICGECFQCKEMEKCLT